jgi:hypothetical protein
VGGPTQSDPPETGDAPEPAVFMPAHPELDETARIVGVDLDVLVLG